MKTSVALCTYNGEKFINEQIDSILNQTLKIDEIIVCDDGSTDKTLNIINQYALENVSLFKIYKNEKNLRSVKNFEKAISLCTGDIIFLSDQDDVWAKNKVEDYLTYFEKNPTIDVLASNGYCIDENSQITEKYAVWDVPQFLKEKNIVFDYYKLICYVDNLATGASMAFRKKIIPEIIPFPQIKDFHHDEWIAMVSSKKNKFILLNDKYFYYRNHENQQVGVLFFDKTESKKNDLIFKYAIDQKSITFTDYKQQLKKLFSAYQKNKKLVEISGEYSKIFEENLIEIEKSFNTTRKKMNNFFPILSRTLTVTDKILNKRQL